MSATIDRLTAPVDPAVDDARRRRTRDPGAPPPTHAAHGGAPGARARDPHPPAPARRAAVRPVPGAGRREPVGSMPGVERVTPDEARPRRARARGPRRRRRDPVRPAGRRRTRSGTGGWVEDGIVQETLRRLRDADLDLVLIADTCLCEYTDHGHCGPLRTDGRVDNDAAIELLARTAASPGRGRRRHRRARAR